ncbi:MAG: hypothetical protein AAFR81_12335 [Chloroflexota bacterium]
MFILLRRVERWLHQHVFKVGWLVTQNYQTTTILYYTVFLPGVLLHEIVYWLAAGIFNVRAEGDIKWPDEQEVGELKLNFIKLAPRTGTYRKAFITSAPLLVGLVCIWLVANNIFDITTVVQTVRSGEINDVVAAWQLLSGAPLFWLWVYIIFTIANTMFPTVPKDLRGWRSILLGFGVVAVALLVLGVGGEIFEALQTPLSQLISVLQSTFILIMLIDVMMVLVLGLIEYTIERSTGRSATFRRGKMITMTREEVLAEREKERERQQKAREREVKKQAAQSITQSIYALPFATPGSPKDIGITALDSLIEAVPDEVEETIEEATSEPSMPVFGGLANDGKPAERPLSDEEKAQRAAIAERVNLPKVPTVPKPSDFEPVTEDDSDDVDETVSETTPAMPSRFSRSAPPAITPEVEDDDAEEIEVPAASAPSRFSRPLSPATTSSPTDDDADDDEGTVEDKPAITTSTSRFGRSLSPAKPSPVDDDTDDDEETVEDKPTATTSRFGRPLSPTAPKPVEADTDTDDEDEIGEKPATSTKSLFGKPSSETTKPAPLVSDEPPKLDEPEEVIAVVGRPASPSLFSEETEDDESVDDVRRRKGDDAVGSLFAQLQRSDSEDDESAGQAVASTKSRFSFLGGEDDDFDEDEDDESVGSRFGSSSSRFSSRFGITTDEDNSDNSDDDDESVGSGSRFGSRPSAFGSRFGATKDDSDDESVGSRFGSGSSRFGQTLGTPSFGTSRPAPKPSASRDDDEDDSDAYSDDEIVYEDIEDVSVYDYEDEEDYIEYDDDGSYYYDDDD